MRWRAASRVATVTLSLQQALLRHSPVRTTGGARRSCTPRSICGSAGVQGASTFVVGGALAGQIFTVWLFGGEAIFPDIQGSR